MKQGLLEQLLMGQSLGEGGVSLSEPRTCSLNKGEDFASLLSQGLDVYGCC